MVVRSIVAGVFGIFTGLAIGQFSSMVMRRSLVAGLLAGVLAVVMIGWSTVVMAWDLPWLLFLLPVPLGFFLASWLRAPDWIADRNNVRGWAKVLLAIAVPIAIVVAMIPQARLAIVPEKPGQAEFLETRLALSNLDNTPEARRVGDKLMLLSHEIEMVRPKDTGKKNENGEVVRTHEQVLDWYRQQALKNRDVLDRAIELSHSHAGRFPSWESFTNYREVLKLSLLLDQAGDVAVADGELDAALEHYFAAMRIADFQRTGQRTDMFQSQWDERWRWQKLVQWAAHKDQTSERIVAAIGELEKIFSSQLRMKKEEATDPDYVSPAPFEAVMAEYEYLRDVLKEKTFPTYLNNSDSKTTGYLAYLVNKLPFERKRALWLLDVLTVENLELLSDVQLQLDQRQLRESVEHLPRMRRKGREYKSWKILTDAALQFRHTLRVSDRLYDYHWGRYRMNWSREPWTWLRTSYLLRNEYQNTSDFGYFLRNLANTEVSQLGLKVQLALIAYRLDHDEYPQKLAALVPDYLPHLPIDPYAGHPLGYERTGLPGKLKCHSPHNGNLELESLTPFVWSVGISNSHWVALPAKTPDLVDFEVPDLRDPALEGLMEYQFISQDGGAQRYNALVFPLPK